MEFLQLEYFCDAARTENLSKTAKKYFVPPSSISQSIKRLESELECELFDHYSNKITLNEKGKLFYESVSKGLSYVNDAKAAIAESKNKISGDIKIFCLCNRGTVTRAIERFTSIYPEVNFILDCDYIIREGYDILINTESEFEYVSKTLLFDEDILIAMHKRNPLADKKDLCIKDLKNERFITGLRAPTVDACEEAGFTPNITFQVNDSQYVRKYVELGLGIAFTPAYSWRGTYSENVVLRNVGIKRKTYAYLPANKRIKKSVEYFLDILIEESSDARQS